MRDQRAGSSGTLLSGIRDPQSVDRQRREAEDEHHQGEDARPRAGRAERLVLVDHRRVARADDQRASASIRTVISSQLSEKNVIDHRGSDGHQRDLVETSPSVA